MLTDEYIIGVSRDYSSIEQIRKAYQESLNAVEFAKERGKKVMKYQQLGLVGSFLKPEQGMGLGDLVESTIRPIIHTQECDGKLLATLQAYFRNNESLIETSKELFLHRNSLKYRLDTVEKLTGLSLCRTEDKLKLYLGVKAYEILNTDPETAGA
jgi:purine catabolism regulator